MSALIPLSRPQASRDTVIRAATAAWRKKHDDSALPDFFVLAVRAYYRDTMGKPGVNDVGMYDDAFFIVSPHTFTAWNGNTDPSRYGWNPNADGFMARLQTGCWKFVHWYHRQTYWAFGQGENEVTVDRIEADGKVHNTITGCYGINLHRGGNSGTSSEGCLTVPREQWEAFHADLWHLMKFLKRPRVDLILIDGPIN
jgi:lysozyme